MPRARCPVSLTPDIRSCRYRQPGRCQHSSPGYRDGCAETLISGGARTSLKPRRLILARSGGSFLGENWQECHHTDPLHENGESRALEYLAGSGTPPVSRKWVHGRSPKSVAVTCRNSAEPFRVPSNRFGTLFHIFGSCRYRTANGGQGSRPSIPRQDGRRPFHNCTVHTRCCRWSGEESNTAEIDRASHETGQFAATP